MANLTRAEELVQTMERDPTFQQEMEAAPTVSAKRSILDDYGWQDVTFEDMKAYVESQGGTLIVKRGDRELSDAELDAVVGGLTDDEVGGVAAGVMGVATLAALAAVAAG
jgi:hypothetical protein